MGDVLAYEAELLGLVREVGFLSFGGFFVKMSKAKFHNACVQSQAL